LTNASERSHEEERIAKYTTQMYRAPEMVDLYMRRQLDEKVDIWVSDDGELPSSLTCLLQADEKSSGILWSLFYFQALGCIFFAVAHLAHPFQDAGNLGILNGRQKRVDVPPDAEDIHEMITRMLHLDADARLNHTEVRTAKRRAATSFSIRCRCTHGSI